MLPNPVAKERRRPHSYADSNGTLFRQTGAWLGLVCGGAVHAHDCARLQTPLTLSSRATEADLASRRSLGSADGLVVHSTRKRGFVAAEDAWVGVGVVERSAAVGDDV
jgi:hypothetical protein